MSEIEDVSFFNILGEEVSRKQLVQQMIDYYAEKLEVGETRVTDFNEGSEIRNLLEAFAVDLYGLLEDQYELSKIAFINTAYGEWLDLHGENPLINRPRDTGTESVGLLTFTIPTVMTGDFVIPEGTVVSTNDGNSLDFATEEEAYITAGETSVDVFSSCLTVGSEGNVKANTITVIDESLLGNTVSVNNNDVFAGGTDYEEDDVYRERLLEELQKSTFGSIVYYENLGNNVDGVHDVALIDATGYTKKVLVNGEDKPTSDEVLLAVLKEFTDTNNIVLGHNFTVDKPSYSTLNLTLNLTVENEIPTTDINELLSCFFNGGTTSNYLEFTGLNIMEDLTKRALYSAIEQLDYIVDVEVLYNSAEITTIPCPSNSVFKLGTVTINQTLEE